LGICWVSLSPVDGAEAVRELRADLAPAQCVVLDAPAELRAEIDPWGLQGGAALELMRRTKARFDPNGVCSPGVFVGGI
jgi:FAD/FMN-containing dehydrogenase